MRNKARNKVENIRDKKVKNRKNRKNGNFNLLYSIIIIIITIIFLKQTYLYNFEYIEELNKKEYINNSISKGFKVINISNLDNKYYDNIKNIKDLNIFNEKNYIEFSFNEYKFKIENVVYSKVENLLGKDQLSKYYIKQFNVLENGLCGYVSINNINDIIGYFKFKDNDDFLIKLSAQNTIANISHDKIIEFVNSEEFYELINNFKIYDVNKREYKNLFLSLDQKFGIKKIKNMKYYFDIFSIKNNCLKLSILSNEKSSKNKLLESCEISCLYDLDIDNDEKLTNYIKKDIFDKNQLFYKEEIEQKAIGNIQIYFLNYNTENNKKEIFFIKNGKVFQITSMIYDKENEYKYLEQIISNIEIYK